MRFSAIIVSSVLAALSVSAQNITSSVSSTLATSTTTVVSGTAPITPAQSSEAACLVNCPANDQNCRSQCIPLGSSTNGIADCITACPKGNGTASDNLTYQNCVQSCITSAAYSATASPTTAGNTGAGATTGAAATGSAATGGSGTTATGSSTAAATSKASAADNVRIGGSILGAAGLFAAIFAL